MSTTHESGEDFATQSPVPVVRCVLGGVLMGLANLVPGISGGTMLVACGIYRRFIDAIADVTRFKLSTRVVLILGCVVGGAAFSIVALASVIAWALVELRWVMFALFIGLTLGGVPILWKMAKPMGKDTGVGLALGLVAMGALVYLQESGAGGGSSSGFVWLIVGGAAAASAMILPGVSGAFLLLLLGLYETIIGAIKDTLSAAKDGNVDALVDQLSIVVPVGIGVVIGVVGVSNLLRWVLHRYERATLGFLLGLILAAPLGLYPFREGVEPAIGDVIKNEVVTAENLDEMRAPDNAKDWDQRAFAPSAVQVLGAMGLIAVGFGVTMGIAKLGGEEGSSGEEPTKA
jgi:putative membrane protein